MMRIVCLLGALPVLLHAAISSAETCSTSYASLRIPEPRAAASADDVGALEEGLRKVCLLTHKVAPHVDESGESSPEPRCGSVAAALDNGRRPSAEDLGRCPKTLVRFTHGLLGPCTAVETRSFPSWADLERFRSYRLASPALRAKWREIVGEEAKAAAHKRLSGVRHRMEAVRLARRKRERRRVEALVALKRWLLPHSAGLELRALSKMPLAKLRSRLRTLEHSSPRFLAELSSRKQLVERHEAQIRRLRDQEARLGGELEKARAALSAAGSATRETRRPEMAMVQKPALTASWEATLVGGLAKFLIDRAKTELVGWLRERLDDICRRRVGAITSPRAGGAASRARGGAASRARGGTASPSGRTASRRREGVADQRTVKDYAPNLCRIFAVGGNTGFSLLGLGKALSAAAVADLTRLPDRLLWGAQTRSNEPALFFLGRVMYALVEGILRGRNPLDLLTGLERIAACGPNLANVQAALRLLGRHARVLVPLVRGEHTPAAPSRFGVAASLLLLRQDHDGVQLVLPVSLEVLWRVHQALRSIIGEVRKLLGQIAVEASDEENSEQTKARERRAAQERVSRARRIIRLLNRVLVAGIRVLPRSRRAVLEPDSAMFEKVSQIGEAIVARNFAGAIPLAATLLEDTKVLPDEAMTILSLGAELATATSSEDVAKILEAAAAPPAGYRAKYRRNVFSLTAYLGAGLFGDRPTAGAAGISRAAYPVGMVGFEISTNLGRYFHVGGYLSLLDLGGVFRWGQDGGPEVDDSNEITFAKVFSPGLFLTIGLGGSPVTLGFGVSLVPDTFRLGPEGDGKASALRIGGFLAMDLSLFSF